MNQVVVQIWRDAEYASSKFNWIYSPLEIDIEAKRVSSSFDIFEILECGLQPCMQFTVLPKYRYEVIASGMSEVPRSGNVLI